MPTSLVSRNTHTECGLLGGTADLRNILVGVLPQALISSVVPYPCPSHGSGAKLDVRT